MVGEVKRLAARVPDSDFRAWSRDPRPTKVTPFGRDHYCVKRLAASKGIVRKTDEKGKDGPEKGVV